jgi:hypothetical protein
LFKSPLSLKSLRACHTISLRPKRSLSEPGRHLESILLRSCVHHPIIDPFFKKKKKKKERKKKEEEGGVGS